MSHHGDGWQDNKDSRDVEVNEYPGSENLAFPMLCGGHTKVGPPPGHVYPVKTFFLINHFDFFVVSDN